MNNEFDKDLQDIPNEDFQVLSPFQRVIKIFTSPVEVFRSINVKPNFWLPVIIIIVVTLGFYLLFFSQFKDLLLQSMEEQMRNASNPVPEDFIQKTAKFSAISTVVMTPIISVAGILLSALYYWLFGMLLKGKGGYIKYVSLMANVSLITLLSVIVMSVMVLITGEFQVNEPITSLASLLPDSMFMTPLSGMATKIEVFTIWRMILIYLGLKEIGGLSSKKSLIIVIIAFVLGMLFTGGSIWFSSLMNRAM